MNYIKENSKFHELALNLLDGDFANVSILIIAVATSQAVDKINRHLMKNVPTQKLCADTQIKEGENDDERLQSKNAQLQHLKDRLRIEAGKNQSLRNQIKVFKSR